MPFKSICDRKLIRPTFLLLKWCKFSESITKFYEVKYFWIFHETVRCCSQISFFSWWEQEKNYFNQFSSKKKKLKNGHFWPPLHKSKLIFHAYDVDIQNFYKYTI